MPTNIATIESLLTKSKKALNCDEISALTHVKKTSITAVITRLTRMRDDVVRTSFKGRSYYCIGSSKSKLVGVNTTSVNSQSDKKTIQHTTPLVSSKKPNTRSSVRRLVNGRFATHGTVPVLHPKSDMQLAKGFSILHDTENTLIKSYACVPTALSLTPSSPVHSPHCAENPSKIQGGFENSCNQLNARSIEFDLELREFAAHYKEGKTSKVTKKECDIKVTTVKKTERPKSSKGAFTLPANLFRGWRNPETGLQSPQLGTNNLLD